MEPEVALGNLTFAGREGFGPIGNTSNLTVDQLLAMLNPENYPRSYVNERLTRHSVIIAFYSTIVLVSLFGNLFVCYVITKRRRMRTRTNFLMTNMAVSDLVYIEIWSSRALRVISIVGYPRALIQNHERGKL